MSQIKTTSKLKNFGNKAEITTSQSLVGFWSQRKVHLSFQNVEKIDRNVESGSSQVGSGVIEYKNI